MKDYGLYIDGSWTPASDGQTFETRSPVNGELLATFAQGTAEDVHRAIDAAERAFPNWSRVPPPKRGEILLEASQILRRRKKELGELVSMEMGKIFAEGAGEVQEAIDFWDYIAGEGRRLLGETTPSELPDKLCMVVRKPVGVVGCITPWNFPMAIPSWKLGTALLCGNTVVFKPASVTPLCAARMVEVLEEAGVPAGVVNMVTGPGSVVGGEIATNPRVKAVSFTGSVPVGRELYVESAKLLKGVELELGGKNPQIVMDDANLELAVEGALFGAFGTSGQRCSATSRLIVHEKVYAEVLEGLLDGTRALKIGDPLDPSVDVAAVCSPEQEKIILDYIDVGKGEGARLLHGGKKLTGGMFDKGHFVEPTVFEAKHGMRIAQEEIFGPVLAVIKVADYAEAIRVANDVEYGLSSSIYTQDVNTAFRAVDDLAAGVTYINAPTIGAEVHLPWGGVKNSGNGGREAGTVAIDEFTELKTVFIDYSGRLQKAQIGG